MLKKIYQELVAIRKELQAIRNEMKFFSEEDFKDYINSLLAEDCLQKIRKSKTAGASIGRR